MYIARIGVTIPCAVAPSLVKRQTYERSRIDWIVRTWVCPKIVFESRCLCELQTSKPCALYPDSTAIDLHRGSG